MRAATRIAVLYVFIAIVATVANLGAQAIVVWIYAGVLAVELSILVGTAVGLPLKYVLDKHFIFEFRSDNLAHDGRLFLLYSFIGIFTTALFWGIEYAFHWMFGTDQMRYVGGALGLALGYAIKYQLDKRFVFAPQGLGAAEVA